MPSSVQHTLSTHYGASRLWTLSRSSAALGQQRMDTARMSCLQTWPQVHTAWSRISAELTEQLMRWCSSSIHPSTHPTRSRWLPAGNEKKKNRWYYMQTQHSKQASKQASKKICVLYMQQTCIWTLLTTNHHWCSVFCLFVCLYIFFA